MKAVSRYRSKVDWWMGVLLAVPLVTAVGTAIALQLGSDAGAANRAWMVLFGVVALYVVVVWPVVYELTDDALVVRFGLMRRRIAYRSLRGVNPTRSILASPALSLDRLAIDTGGSLSPTISPADREGFLADLSARTPHLVRDDDRLIARQAG
jgi:uncharacterized membrane protein YdbT with pleckstrin-like domain